MTQKKNILVIQPLPGIGDVLWFDTHIQALASSAGQGITLMTKKTSKADEIYKDSAYITDFIWITPKHKVLLKIFGLTGVIRRRKFDEVYIFHKSWRHVLMCYMAGVKKIYSVTAGSFKYLIHNSSLTLQESCMHHTLKADLLLSKLGIKRDPLSQIKVNSISTQNVLKKFSAYPKPWIVFGIASQDLPRKWPWENYVELITYYSKNTDFSLFVLGGKLEEHEGIKIQDHVVQNGGGVHAVTSLPLSESIAFLNECSLYIGNDCSMMNVAASLNKITVGLFIKHKPFSYKPNMYPCVAKNNQGKEPILSPQEVIKFVKDYDLLRDCK